MPRAAPEPGFTADALRELINAKPKATQDLFAKVINMYAGFNLKEKSEGELQAQVRRAIEESVR